MDGTNSKTAWRLRGELAEAHQRIEELETLIRHIRNAIKESGIDPSGEVVKELTMVLQEGRK